MIDLISLTQPNRKKQEEQQGARIQLYQNQSPLYVVGQSSSNKNNTPKSPPKFLFIIIICLIFIFAAWQGADFLELNADGELVLSKARQEKLDKALEELKEGEQYVLIAGLPRHYPCYSCPNDTSIFLFSGEVWKYGITTKGQSGRYPSGLPAIGLVYRTQFKGTVQDCLMEERRKIFQFALLPENIKREPPLIRPPGNKQDN